MNGMRIHVSHVKKFAPENKQRLELTWLGKNDWENPEPRLLIKKETYLSAYEGRDDNLLIYGDNLLGLKALECDYIGKVKCIYIDPPYNTKSLFSHYKDNLEHSVWLNMMKERLVIMHKLLREDGSIWISIDDSECHYLKVMCDEIFGRKNFVANIVIKTSGNSNNNSNQFSLDHNHILVYGKRKCWSPKKDINITTKQSHFKNPDNDPRGPWFDGNPLNSPKPRPNLTYEIESPNGFIIKPPKNGWRWSFQTLKEKIEKGEIRFSNDGKRILRRTYLQDMKGLPPSSLWSTIEETGHNCQAKYELKKLFPATATSKLFSTPKPERLIQRILHIATNPRDLVLDSFAGSGTTGAVAHKMDRRWIMIELGDHCHTHIIPRMKKVIDGEDAGGITKNVNWQGGGGFEYCELAPSMS